MDALGSCSCRDESKQIRDGITWVVTLPSGRQLEVDYPNQRKPVEFSLFDFGIWGNEQASSVPGAYPKEDCKYYIILHTFSQLLSLVNQYNAVAIYLPDDGRPREWLEGARPTIRLPCTFSHWGMTTDNEAVLRKQLGEDINLWEKIYALWR